MNQVQYCVMQVTHIDLRNFWGCMIHRKKLFKKHYKELALKIHTSFPSKILVKFKTSHKKDHHQSINDLICKEGIPLGEREVLHEVLQNFHISAHQLKQETLIKELYT